MDQIENIYLLFLRGNLEYIQWTINKTCGLSIIPVNLYVVDQIVENFIKTCTTILFQAVQVLPLVDNGTADSKDN